MTVWSDAVAALSPYAWYKLDEATGPTAADSSGNGRNGSYFKTATTYGQPALVPGDAGSQSVTQADGSVLSNDTMSLSATSITYAVTLQSTVANNTVFFEATNSTGLTHVDWGRPRHWISGALISPTRDASASTANVWDGNPHLIVVTVSATEYKWYFDGNLVASGTHTAAAGNVTRVAHNSTSSGWTGASDEFVLWDRPLTTTEVADLWTAWQGGGGGPAPTDLTLAGTLPAVTGSASLTAAPGARSLSLSGTLPTVTGSLALDASVSAVQVSLTASLPAVTGALSLDAAVAPTGVEQAVTNTVNRANGRTRVCEWSVSIDPPVTEPTRDFGHDYAVTASISGATEFIDGRPT